MTIRRNFSVHTKNAVTAVAWSADGQKITASFNYGQNFIVLRSDGKVISQFSRTTDGPVLGRSIAFSRDGSELFVQSSMRDSIIDVYNGRYGEFVRIIHGSIDPKEREAVNSEKFSVSSKSDDIVAMSHLGRFMFFLDGRDFSIRRTVKFDKGISALDWQSSRAMVAVGLWPGNVAILNSETAEIEKSVTPFGFSKFGSPDIEALAISPDGRLLFVGARGVTGAVSTPEEVAWRNSFETARVIKISDGSVVKVFSNVRSSIGRAEWSADGRFLTFIDDNCIYLWFPDEGSRIISNKIAQSPFSLSISPDSRMIAVAENSGVEVFDVVEH